MKHVYLALAIIGAVVPWAFFTEHFRLVGPGPADFIGALFVNGAAGGLTADLLISSIAFWVYLVSRKVALTPVYVLITLTVGLSCALPLFLYMLERTTQPAPAVTTT